MAGFASGRGSSISIGGAANRLSNIDELAQMINWADENGDNMMLMDYESAVRRAEDLRRLVISLFERLRHCGATMRDLLAMLGDSNERFDVSRLLLSFSQSFNAATNDCQHLVVETEGRYLLVYTAIVLFAAAHNQSMSTSYRRISTMAGVRRQTINDLLLHTSTNRPSMLGPSQEVEEVVPRSEFDAQKELLALHTATIESMHKQLADERAAVVREQDGSKLLSEQWVYVPMSSFNMQIRRDARRAVDGRGAAGDAAQRARSLPHSTAHDGGAHRSTGEGERSGRCEVQRHDRRGHARF